ncbi:NAD(P)H-dependent oxidoreductase [Aurantibacter crassamenti]|uniref:NAD(P)H-dependent oxidoreductase n=1 Tax=Aurantibacter crassamenti TaxID=1837375 RepID=UPI00193A7E29|nr:NAD(P)H-dependent oxidoreductase [Aurantibacter crassamenti]MBM1107313.1 NAD(P)H-dependent oxidoreductase [Aurantibacter crassamenti]
MKDIIEHMKWRYAVKKFDSDRILSKEKIDKLKEAFNLTATSYGLQPISLLIVKNKELQNELMTYSYHQPQVVQASHILVFCIKDTVDANYISKYFEQIKKVREVSDEILEPFKNDLLDSFSKKDIEQIKKWSTNQAYLAMGNLLTVCAVERIDSCPMEGFQPEAYDKLLNLKEEGLTSVLAMPIGYRADDDIFAGFKKVRKDMAESVIEID